VADQPAYRTFEWADTLRKIDRRALPVGCESKLRKVECQGVPGLAAALGAQIAAADADDEASVPHEADQWHRDREWPRNQGHGVKQGQVGEIAERPTASPARRRKRLDAAEPSEGWGVHGEGHTVRTRHAGPFQKSQRLLHQEPISAIPSVEGMQKHDLRAACRHSALPGRRGVVHKC
jgi:hypothetical protein